MEGECVDDVCECRLPDNICPPCGPTECGIWDICDEGRCVQPICSVVDWSALVECEVSLDGYPPSYIPGTYIEIDGEYPPETTDCAEDPGGWQTVLDPNVLILCPDACAAAAMAGEFQVCRPIIGE
jgi:hypothetical protein